MRSLSDVSHSTRIVYLVAGIVSLVLSYWIAIHQAIVNPDAICYLLGANEIGESGIKAAMHLCGQSSWPFYPTLIYFFSKLSFLSPTTAAYLLNAFFTLVTVLSFIAIINMLGGNQRVLWLAAFVILFAHQFNAVRQYIVRDHGFWAFYLLSLIFMLRFLRDNRISNAWWFSLSLIMATLFRVEGAVFLVLLPLLALFVPGSLQVRLLAFAKLNSMTICVLLAAGLWMLMHPGQSLHQLGRVPELLNQSTHGLMIAIERFQSTKAALIQYVLPHEAARDAGMVWLAVLIGLYVTNIISNLSIIATILVVYAWISKVSDRFSDASKVALYAYLLVNAVICAIFFAERMFFSKRYLIAMSLIFLLWVPFALEKLLRPRVQSKRHYVGYVAMTLYLAASLGVLLNTGVSKQYVRDAGNWIAVNIPATARLYSNDLQLSYYSNHYGKKIFGTMDSTRHVDAVLANGLKDYEYVVLSIRHKRDNKIAMFMNDIHAPLIKDFMNQSGDHVKIYKMPQ